VSSATLDAATFLNYFSDGSEDDVIAISLEGRMFPVEIAYLQDSTSDYVKTAAEVAFGIHQHVRLAHHHNSVSWVPQSPMGDILIFLTGREEIDRCLEELSDGIARSVYCPKVSE
jgi:ATP-dependent RNA helicase DDX35